MNETTQLQKAIVIAKKDGWKSLGKGKKFYEKAGDIRTFKDTSFELAYTTDLNYLVPVAVRLLSYKQKPVAGERFDAVTASILKLQFMPLRFALEDLTKTPSGTYQPLFDAVYNAIVYLKNQKA